MAKITGGAFGVAAGVVTILTQAEPLVEKAIDKRKKFIENHICLENIVDSNFKEAQAILEEKGFKVVTIKETIAKKKYANRAIDIVVDRKPKPTPIQRHFLPSTLVKIYYVDQKIIEESKKLLEQAHEKNKEEKRDRQKKLNF